MFVSAVGYKNSQINNYNNSNQYHIYTKNNTSFQSKENEKPKFSVSKIAGFVLGLSTIAIGTILFKKWNPKPIKELAQHIDFVKADKIEDAIKFAQENLGVKLEVNGQLKTANWINESLVNLSNKTKGKVLLPRKIKICKLPKMINGKYNPFTKTVNLAEYSFGTSFERDFEKVKKIGLLEERLVTLYHEIGHGIHLSISNIFNEIFSTPRFKKIVCNNKEKLIQYLGSEYFTRSEGEAFSQIFGKKMAEVDLPNYVEEIWKKLGGKY